MKKKAQNQSLLSRPIFWIGIVVVGGIAFLATSPDEPREDAAQRTPARRAPATTTTVVFTEEDRNANFEPLNQSARNAFNPLVARRVGGLGTGEAGAANLVPSDFAGGEGNWIYTGSAEIDGVLTALLENRTTQDGVFLRAGDRWKRAVVQRITPTSVVLAGPSGVVTLSLVDDFASPGGGGGAQLRGEIGTGFAPAQVGNLPPMRGPIGNLTAIPDGTAPVVMESNDED
jgi:hypothetical protein